MSRADDIVRERLSAQAESRAQHEQQARAGQLDALRNQLAAAISRLLVLLEQHDYPEAQLVWIAGPKGWFGNQGKSVQKAAWLLHEERTSDSSHSLWLLSDGRMLTSGGLHGPNSPFTVDDIADGNLSVPLLKMLEQAPAGFDRLIARYA
jgi:hypothetical protein